MTRDDIIRVAREASETTNWKPALGNEHVVEFLERFAALARAAGEQAERERTSRLVEDMQAELRRLRSSSAEGRQSVWSE